MDEKYLQDLYGVVLKNDPSYRQKVSFDLFRSKMQDQDYAGRLTDWVSSVDSTFKPQSSQPVVPFKKKEDTVSSSVLGSSAFGRFDPRTGKLNQEQPQFQRPQDRDFSGLAVDVDPQLLTKQPRPEPSPLDRPVVSQDVTAVNRLPKTQTLEVEENKKYIKETERLKNEAQNLEKLKEAEQQDLLKEQNLFAIKDPEFGSLITQINKDLINNEETEVTDFLNKQFSKYGFHFESTGVGDAVIARTIDGKQFIEIDLDPFLESTEIEESEKLRKFISKNAQPAYNYKDEDYITKAVRAQSLRDVGMKNEDGTESTVKFTSFEQDGKHFVIPTLFPKNTLNYTSDKKDWLELPFEQALKEARSRGEVFEFDNEADAKRFAEGDWKNVNAFDLEGQKLYKEKGLDYYTEKKKFENYNALQDEVELLDRILDRDYITPEEKLKYPQYFAKDGRPLYSEKEIESRLDKTVKQKDQLLEQVFDVEFLGINDGPVQKTREEFDIVLSKKQKEIEGQAINQNNQVNAELQQVNLMSMNLYGVPIEKLYTVVPKTSEDEKTINDLVLKTKELIAMSKDAANKFQLANTYYDAKWNKAATEEYEENLSGFNTALADAWQNGKAAEQILLATLGIKDVDATADRKDIAMKIAEASSNLSGKQSRVLTRLNLSRDGEFFKTFMSDPLEAMSTFAASSFTQILPYGSYLIPSIVGSSVAAGAVIGGSTAGAPGALAGATTGLGYGVRSGMAASFFALEYTNSILDVMKEKGYDITDPLQVEKGLMDESVWSEGSERGVKRGIPIALVDYLGAGLAGKVFKVSKIAPIATRAGALAAERLVVDPAFEMGGELAAQVSAGQDINMKEIAYEGMGGVGTNTSMMGMNMYIESRNQTSAQLALELTDINAMASQRVSDERISNWANNMQKLGKIDADVNQRIQQNVGLRREARDLLSVGAVSRLTGNTSKSEARVMELLAARQELTSTQNRREVNSDKIKAINQELAELSETKKVKPKEEQVNLDLILGTKREGVSVYRIGGKTMTKEQFLKEIEKMSTRSLLRSKIVVDNDDETQIEILNKQIDAIQKQTAGQVPVQPGTRDRQEMAQGEPQAELEVPTQEGQAQEEVVDIESKAGNKNTEVKNISFNKEQTTVNDEGFFDLAFEGSLLDDYDFLAQGTESKVYLSKDKSHVIKLSEPYSSKDPNVYEKRVTTGLLKDILGDSGIEIVGYYEYDGTKNPIFRQNYIEGQPLTQKESEDYLRNNQRVVEIDNKFYTKYNNVLYRISDFENNLIRDNNGKVVPIDLNISEVKDSKIINRYDSSVSQEGKAEAKPISPTQDVTALEAQLTELYSNFPTEITEENKPQADQMFNQIQDLKKRIAEAKLTPQQEELIDDIDEAMRVSSNTLRTSFPDVKVILADGIEDAKAQIVEQLTPVFGRKEAQKIADTFNRAKGRAVFADGKPVAVIVDKKRARASTLAHETWHVILREAFGNDPAKFKSFRDSIEKQLRDSGYSDVADYLNNFSSLYKGEVSYEEYLSELGGLLATKGFDPKNLSSDEKNLIEKIKEVINKFAREIIGKDVFLKDATPENVLEFMINISDMIAKGQDVRPAIGKVEGKKEAAKGVESLFQADFSDKFSKLTFVYDKNSEAFNKLKRDGFINDDVPLSAFNGKIILLHQPDAAFSGEIQKNGETIVEGKGGIFYPAKFHDQNLFWASTKNGASSLANSLNEVSKRNGGKIYMALTSAPYDKLLSSTTMSNAVVDFFSSKIVDENFNVSEPQLKSALLDAAKFSAVKKIKNDDGTVSVKNVGLKLKIDEKENIESIKSKIAEKLASDNSTFADRKTFVLELIRLMATQINKNDVSINSFGKLFSEGIQNKYFKGITKTGKIKISPANMTQALSEMFTEPMLKEGFDNRSKGGQVYAILEVDGEVETVDSDLHESYPKAIKSKNPVKIHIINDRLNWYDVFNKEGQEGGIVEDDRKKVYPTSGISTTGLELKAPEIEVRDERAQPDRGKSEIDKVISKAIKDAGADLNAKRKAIADAVKGMSKKGGKINAKTVEAIIKRAEMVNLNNQTAVDKFIAYAGKIFKDAEYGKKLNDAKAKRKTIRRGAKSKEVAANLRDLAKLFSVIDPSMVEDIDKYNQIADKISEAVVGSSLRGKDGTFAKIIKTEGLTDYINENIEKQQKQILKDKIARMSEVVGKNLTEEEYFEVLEARNKDAKVSKELKSAKVKENAIKEVNMYKSIVREILDKDVNPISGEDVTVSDAKKKVVEKFMSMDLNLLDVNELLDMFDSLQNFIENGSTAKMESIYSSYVGKVNATKAKGIISQKIKKYFNETVGEFLLEQFTSLDLLFERMFKGFERGGKIMSLSGVSAIKKGKSTAKALSDAIVDQYFNKFYKLTPNGQAFNTMYNTVERGMLAYMMRNVIGTEEQVQAEFDRRKELIVDSIKVLEKGDKNHRQLAVEYAKAFNRILQDSENSEDVMMRSHPINVDAVKFWQTQWADKYDQLADLSENIYNQTLGKDVNYTPDRVSSIEKESVSSETGDEMDSHLMTFHANNKTPYQRKTGVLMTPVMDDTLPKKSYINLSFDSNNANSMYDALVDLNTAGPIRQVSAFFNSPEFDQIVPDLTDRKILRSRVNLFIRNIRNKNPYENDSFAKAIRALQNLAALGTGQILAGPTQIPKQTIPVILNTIVNAGGIDLAAPFNEDKNNFMNRSGYSIAYRSAASQNQIATLNKISTRAETGPVGKVGDAIFALNDLQLKYFLQKPDAYVARASWMSYYEKSLKKQGIDPKTIDYATHEVNDTAADYAQRMVDRQQNISDMDLAGKFIASKNPANQLINKLLLPFASFRINQSARLGSDWATLTSKVSTKEDKAIAARSLGGFFSELVAFRAVSIGVTTLLGSMALSIAGKRDDEEDRERKRSTIMKGTTTSTIVDTFSLLPALDPIFQSGVAFGLDVVQDFFKVSEKNRIPFYDAKEKDFIEQAGTLGISMGKAKQFFELVSLAYTGQYTDEYSGKTKYIKSRDANSLKMFVVPFLLSHLGILPGAPEIGTMTRIIMKDVKKDSSTTPGGYKADEMTMEDMKKYFPEEYENQYGEGSPYREAKELEKEANEEKKKEEEELKEAMYGKPASKGRGKGRGQSTRGSSRRREGRR